MTIVCSIIVIDLPDLYENKAKNIAKLKDFIKEKARVTNDEVQNLLKVSDATAGRYLNELEKEGKLKQVGEIGKEVYYERLKS